MTTRGRQDLRFKQRLGGVALALFSGEITFWTWRHGPDVDPYFLKACLLFPAVFLLGVAVVLFPDYAAERRVRGEDISRPRAWRLLTPRWWVVIVVALAAGIANCAYLFGARSERCAVGGGPIPGVAVARQATRLACHSFFTLLDGQ